MEIPCNSSCGAGTRPVLGLDLHSHAVSQTVSADIESNSECANADSLSQLSAAPKIAKPPRKVVSPWTDSRCVGEIGRMSRMGFFLLRITASSSDGCPEVGPKSTIFASGATPPPAPGRAPAGPRSSVPI